MMEGVTMVAQDQMARLRALVDSGYATEEEERQYLALTATDNRPPQDNRPQATTTNTLPPAGQRQGARRIQGRATPPSATYAYSFPVNINSFLGGGDFQAPAQAGILPAICRGIQFSEVDDRITLQFESPEGSAEYFFGTINFNNVTAEQKSGAWALRRTLDQLRVPYECDEHRVNIGEVEEQVCQVDWQWIDNRRSGIRELRIQEAYHKDARIEGLT